MKDLPGEAGNSILVFDGGALMLVSPVACVADDSTAQVFIDNGELNYVGNPPWKPRFVNTDASVTLIKVR
jgi:hypothetical protein